MSLKSSIVLALRGLSRLPPIASVLFQPQLRRNLQRLPGFHAIYGGGWDRPHPFDRLTGADTSGYVAPEDLPSSPFSDTRLHVYGGSQPSIVRAALQELPSLAGYTFVDLGAGKGRPAMVAAEFPFREVVGVELASQLVDIARRNLAIFQARQADRAPIRFEHADAAVFPPPGGDLVVFLYNPFGYEVTKRVVANIEAALAREPRSLFVVYYNPVYGACFDASPMLTRYCARTIAYAAEERGFGPDDADPVVIWQGGSTLAAKPGAEAAIRITRPGYRSELVV